MRVSRPVGMGVRYLLFYRSDGICKYFSDSRMPCRIGTSGKCVEPFNTSLHGRYQLLAQSSVEHVSRSSLNVNGRS